MKVACPMKSWLAEFLLTRGCFQGPNGKPLYTYQLSSDEFSSLKEILLKSRQHALHSVYGRSWAAGFCLFVSESYRREYDASEGGWSWSGFERQLNCKFSPQQHLTLVTTGLKEYWKRPIRELSNRRDFLGSLFLEGGLPWPLVQSETHGFGRAVRKGLKDFYRAQATGRTVSDVLANYDRYLPKTFRTMDTLQLLAGIVEQLMYLVEKYPLREQADPVSYLDSHDERWRYDFPIPLDADNATILISEWLKDAGKRRSERREELEKANYFTCENYLQGELPQWNIKTLLILPKEEMFDVDLAVVTSTRLELAYYEGDDLLARGGVVYAQIEGSGLKVRFPKREISLLRKKVAEPVSMRLLANGRLVCSMYFDNSALDVENSPLIFGAEGEDKKLLANESCRLREKLAVVRIPEYLHQRENSANEIARENKGAIWVTINKDLNLLSEDSYFSIQLNQFGAIDQKPFLKGIPSEYSSSPSMVYMGWPSLELPEDALLQKEDLLQVCNGVNLSPLSRCTQVGQINYAVKTSDGKTVLKRKFGVIPRDLSISLFPESTDKLARVSIIGAGNLHCRVVGNDIFNELIRNEEGVKIYLDYKGDEHPSTFELEISNDLSLEPVKLRLPYPYKGARLIDSNGELSSRRELVINDLLGKRIVLYPCQSHGDEFTLQLELLNTFGQKRFERFYRIKVGQVPVIVGLFNYLNDIQQMLGAIRDQDAYIRMSVETDVRHLSLNIRRYDGHLSWDSPSEFHISDVSDRQIRDGAIAEAMLLSNPKQHPVSILERTSEGVGSGFFAISRSMDRNGPWLIYPSPESVVTFRPKLYVSTNSQINPYEAPDSLHMATQQFHPETNRGVIDIQIAAMASDLDHSGWQYLADIKNNFSNLPLSTFECWLSLSRNSDALAVAVLRLEIDETFCERIRDELAIVWECIPLPIWSETYNVYRSWLCDKGLPTPLVESVLSNRRELLSKVVSGFEHVSDFLCTGLASNLQKAPLEQVLPHWYQDLRRRHESNNHWPNELGVSLSEWVFQRDDIPDSVKKLSLVRYSNSVTFLPIFMAYVTAGKVSMEDLITNREFLVFAIKMISDFDRSAWYEPVHAMVVSHLLYENN